MTISDLHLIETEKWNAGKCRDWRKRERKGKSVLFSFRCPQSDHRSTRFSWQPNERGSDFNVAGRGIRRDLLGFISIWKATGEICVYLRTQHGQYGVRIKFPEIYLFLPESRNPLANGLRSIFRRVICYERTSPKQPCLIMFWHIQILLTCQFSNKEQKSFF